MVGNAFQYIENGVAGSNISFKPLTAFQFRFQQWLGVNTLQSTDNKAGVI